MLCQNSMTRPPRRSLARPSEKELLIYSAIGDHVAARQRPEELAADRRRSGAKGQRALRHRCVAVSLDQAGAPTPSLVGSSTVPLISSGEEPSRRGRSD
jgi:hypothetical protein